MQMWEGLIQKAKDGGLDVIDTYVFWNVHEPSPGNVLFSLKLSLYTSTLFFPCYLLHTLALSAIFVTLLLSYAYGIQSICFVNFSIILRGDTIWFGSSSWCRKPGCMCIFELDHTYVQSGILGDDFFFFITNNGLSLIHLCS